MASNPMAPIAQLRNVFDQNFALALSAPQLSRTPADTASFGLSSGMKMNLIGSV